MSTHSAGFRVDLFHLIVQTGEILFSSLEPHTRHRASTQLLCLLGARKRWIGQIASFSTPLFVKREAEPQR
jgi:hypothetical protein